MQFSQFNAQSLTFFKRFRILFAVYFGFLMLDFTSSDELFPHFVYEFFSFYTNFWHWAVPFTGEHILHLDYPITVRPNGSGDTTYNYVLQLLWIVFAIIIAGIWALLDRKRPSYTQFQYWSRILIRYFLAYMLFVYGFVKVIKLHKAIDKKHVSQKIPDQNSRPVLKLSIGWSRILIRYFLAYMLFVYGFVKVIKLQFPFPDLYRLNSTYGDSSPMGLAWTFIGYSSGYNIFIGLAEVLAGVLLFFKRTTLLGALVSLTVMTNVFAMNMAYDIPVKIFSLNLIFMSVWLAWYDRSRFINFFWLNQTVEPAVLGYPYQTKWKKIIQYALKTLAIGFAFYATFYADYQMAKQYGDAASKPPLYGIYDVKSFQLNGEEVPPLITDSTRWKKMIINYPGNVGLINMTDSLEVMELQVDLKKQILTFSPANNPKGEFQLSFQEESKQGLLKLKGKKEKDSIHISLQRIPLKNFRLYRSSFRWINEYPENL